MLATERLRHRRLHVGLASALAAAAMLASTVRPARAADWPMIQGTEPATADVVRPFGFIQATGEAMLGGRVHGLQSPALAKYDGLRPTFNALDNGGTWGFAVRRARPGLRGAVPGTDGRVSYFLLAELGTAAIAREGPTLTDAAITLSYVPGARLRIGQFKLPVMDEAVEANPLAAEWVNYSLPAASLVNENRVRDGKLEGGASGFRDVGAEVFDTFQRGHLALAYAVMLSNGRRGLTENDASKDVTARTTLSWVFSGSPTDPHRQELSVFAWGQRGEREIAGASVQRIRSGAGVHLEKGPLRVRAEIVNASGALFLGQNPPFAGQPFVLDAHGRAIGGYVQASVRLFGHALVGLRYDELHRQLGDARAERTFRNLSPTLGYDVVPRVRLQATYERRWMVAPDGTPDAKTVARAMGDRAAVQVTLIF